jgi:exopolysaccharide biosynthesis polyprenyl glycosylphosphotransferase
MSETSVQIAERQEQRGPETTRAAWLATRRHPPRQWRDALRRRMLALADATAALLVSISLATFLQGRLSDGLWSAALLPVWILLAKLHGLYDRDQRSLRHLTVDEVPSVFMWALTGTVALSVLLTLIPGASITIATAVWIWLIAGGSALVFRGLVRMAWRRLVPPEQTVIVGEGPLAEAARRKVDLFPDIHVSLVGLSEEDAIDALREPTESVMRVERIILASQRIDEDLIAELVAICRHRQIKLSVIPPARGMFGTAVQLNHIADLPIVEYNTWDVSRSTLALKRMMDVIVSLIALVLLAPLFALTAIAILIDSGRPVLFRQRRAGLDGRAFKIIKFRTMVHNAEELRPNLVPLHELPEPVFKLRDDPRTTRVGWVLRRASLDELPQLLNVLRGEMSLVGPRPEEVEVVELYERAHRFRLAVKPGLTGPMQVFGRGQLTLEERLSVEREYIENLSLGRDLSILGLTLATVVSGRGAF